MRPLSLYSHIFVSVIEFYRLLYTYKTRPLQTLRKGTAIKPAETHEVTRNKARTALLLATALSSVVAIQPVMAQDSKQIDAIQAQITQLQQGLKRIKTELRSTTGR